MNVVPIKQRADARQARPDVRNPILALPAARRLAELDQETRDVLVAILRDLGDDAAERAETSWRKHKAPMAAYWKACAVYSRHIARAIRRAGGRP